MVMVMHTTFRSTRLHLHLRTTYLLPLILFIKATVMGPPLMGVHLKSKGLRMLQSLLDPRWKIVLLRSNTITKDLLITATTQHSLL